MNSVLMKTVTSSTRLNKFLSKPKPSKHSDQQVTKHYHRFISILSGNNN